MAFLRFAALLIAVPLLGMAGSDPRPNLWSISNGITLTATSAIRGGFDASDVFGTRNSALEPGQTVFEDGYPDGFVHFIEWRTQAPVQIDAIRLAAGGDGPIYLNEREMGAFVLKGRLNGEGPYTEIYRSSFTHPYVSLDTNLTVVAASVPAFEGQFFRAEFVQWNAGRGFDGPRIVELEAFGPRPSSNWNDGIPDSWRQRFFPDINSADAGPLADPDQDGANNYQEFVDGSDPSAFQPTTPPLFSVAPDSGAFSDTIFVAIANRSPAAVRYTLDGAEPNADSPIYGSAISLTSSTVLKAQLFVGSTAVSEILTKSYSITQAQHIRPAKDDLFDVKQGAVVLASSAIWSGFFQDAMFGNDSPSVEQGSTVFADLRSEGSIHFIEWKTARPVELTGFNLFASGDDVIYNHEREFDSFVLKAKLRSSEDYKVIYTYRPTHPYSFLDPATVALVSANISPVDAEYFRAEFTQWNAGRGYDGPRIVELDGFGSFLGSSLSDGIPDVWRLQFFGDIHSPSAGALEDPDGDGANNYQEYLDGTNPLVPEFHAQPLVAIYPPAGSYSGAVDVTLTGGGASSVIHYTLDGTAPTVESPLFTSALRLNQSAVVRARLFFGNVAVSGVLDASYVLTPLPAMRPSDSDLFDIRNGARVTRTSRLRSGSTGAEILGAASGQEPGTAIFADGLPEGTVHFVEWQTPTPVLLSSINLYASGDDAVYHYEREFARFTLKARLRTNEAFATVFSFTPDHPYPFLDSSSRAVLTAAFQTVQGMFFRAEFVQRNSGRGFDGPRVIELDGFGSPIPVSLNDGIPDYWRNQFFGSIGSSDAVATADPDHDGAVNFQEYLDGTNPLVPDRSPEPLLTIAPLSGTYSTPISVQISSRGQTTIRYTTDGSVPTSASSVFAGTITISNTTTIQARLFVNGSPVSSVVVQNYTIQPPQPPPSTIGPSHLDLFDVSQGAQVLQTSGVRRGFFADGLLGNEDRSIETGTTIFQDNQPEGFTHFVEFRTAAPVILRKLDLYAAGDGAEYRYEREFASFVLKTKSNADRPEYDVVLATFTPGSHPYLFVGGSPLVFTATSETLLPVAAQFFRAEFVQWNAGRSFDAPRIIELDGFGDFAQGINPIVADWTFEEGQPRRPARFIQDYSGNGNNATVIVGAPLFDPTAIETDGLVSLVTGKETTSGFLTDASQNLDLGDTYTLEALIKPAATLISGPQTIVASADVQTGRLLFAETYDPSGPTVNFLAYGGSGDVFTVSAPFPPELHSHQVAVVRRGQEIGIWVDNTLAATGTATTSSSGSSGAARRIGVGCNPAALSAVGFSGVIDRIRIARKALSPSELFQRSKPELKLIILKSPISNSAEAGETVTFSVEAAAALPISYQWSFNGSAIVGANSNVLTLSSVALEKAGTYSVSLRSGAEETTLQAQLTVREHDTSQLPIISSQPDSQQVPEGAWAQLVVSASSPTALSYQWYRNNQSIAGATSAALLIPSCNLDDAATYRVALQNGVGTISSQPAILNVYRPGSSGGEIYMNNRAGSVDSPVFDENGTALSGQTYLAQLYVGSTVGNLAPIGPAVPFRTGVAAGYFVDPYSHMVLAAASGTTVFAQVRAWDSTAAGTFEDAAMIGALHGASEVFSVTLGGGLIPPAELTGLRSFSLKSGLRIVVPPASADTWAGSSLTLRVEVSGSTPLTYAWSKDGNAIPGADGPSLTLTDMQLTDAGVYRAIVSNGLDTFTSAPATVRVLGNSPAIVITSPSGATTNTTYELVGTVAERIGRLEWEKNGQVVGSLPFSGGEFRVPDLQLSTGDNHFTIRAFDGAGATSVADVVVTLLPGQSVGLPEVSTVQEGARFTLPIIISSEGNVAALAFELNYDTNYLSQPEFTWADGLRAPIQLVEMGVAGKIHGTLALSGQTLPTGDFAVAEVEFRPRSVPSDLEAILHFDLAGIYTIEGDAILSGTEVKSGAVKIIQRSVTGDNNANNRLDVGDAAAILRMVSQMETTRTWDVRLNDLNQNNALDTDDVMRVLRTAAHIDVQPKGAALRAQSAPSEVTVHSSLSADAAQLQAGTKLTVRISIGGRSAPIFGSAFTLSYPTQALRLDSLSSLKTGRIVPQTALSVWNVSPAQTNLTFQDGQIYAAFSSANPWQQTNGEIALVTFTVLPGADAQAEWPIRVSSVELSDGFYSSPVLDGQLTLQGDQSTQALLSEARYTTETGYFALKISGRKGVRYRIDVSEDLQGWVPLATYTLSSTEMVFTDIRAVGRHVRFYRTVQVP